LAQTLLSQEVYSLKFFINVMKQKSLFLLPFFALCAFTNAFSQNADYRSTVSVTAGLNVFQIIALADKVFSDSLGAEVDLKATASYGINYDYGINKWFSIGLATGYNRFQFKSPNIQIDLEDGTTYQGFIDASLSRTNIAIRPLFHYGNKGRIDMYSGFRIGANIWSANIKADRELLPEDFGDVPLKNAGATLGLQFIPFGLRGYVTEHVGLGFELGLGGPHYAALQLDYRF
jgi:hypothetical protein